MKETNESTAWKEGREGIKKLVKYITAWKEGREGIKKLVKYIRKIGLFHGI
jgi:post-segregation antitoxin (ccd killing protein)